MSVRKITLVLFFFCCSAASGQGIENSHHDFKNKVWNGPEGCSPCHLPVAMPADSLESPLWTLHKINFDFNAFSNIAIESNTGQPRGKSKLCLSCHDGNAAIEEHMIVDKKYNKPKSIFQWSSLEQGHPVSVPYNTTKSYKGFLYDPSTTDSGLGGSIEQDLLENGNIECTSCHDIHLFRNKEGCTGCHNKNSTGHTTLSLWKTNDYSELCYTCHKR